MFNEKTTIGSAIWEKEIEKLMSEFSIVIYDNEVVNKNSTINSKTDKCLQNYE